MVLKKLHQLQFCDRTWTLAPSWKLDSLHAILQSNLHNCTYSSLHQGTLRPALALNVELGINCEVQNRPIQTKFPGMLTDTPEFTKKCSWYFLHHLFSGQYHGWCRKLMNEWYSSISQQLLLSSWASFPINKWLYWQKFHFVYCCTKDYFCLCRVMLCWVFRDKKENLKKRKCVSELRNVETWVSDSHAYRCKLPQWNTR